MAESGTLESLGGVERALVLILALDEEVASRIVSELSEAEIQKLHQATQVIRQIDLDALTGVYKTFLSSMQKAQGLPKGATYLRKLATRALGQHRAQKLLKDSQDSGSALERLQHYDPRTLAAVLERENPQAVAAILANLDASFAADILAQMETEAQYAIFRRLTRLGEVPEATLREVTESLTSELAALGDSHSTSVDGLGRAAAILQNTGSEAVNSILARLETEDPSLAGEIRRSMFTFADLVKLDRRSMQALIREISTDQLVIALKTASEETRAHFLENVSSRAAEMIQEDLAALGPMKISDVERAQLEIVETAQRLESEGKIVIMGGGEELV
jgi:flagellar motor switch protein FliG